MKRIKLWYKKELFEILVDDEDYDRVIKLSWYFCIRQVGKTVNAKINGKTISIANFIMEDYKNLYDHINRNPLDNQKENLRICKHYQNTRNTGPKIGKKYKGVWFDKKSNKYQSYICVLYKKYALGLFKTEVEAAKAYNVAALKHFGEFACLNIIPGEPQNDIPLNQIKESSNKEVKI